MTYNMKLRNQLLQFILMRESGRVKGKKIKVKSLRKYQIQPGRSDEWWNGFVKDEVWPDEWKHNFRMSRESFYFFCDKL